MLSPKSKTSPVGILAGTGLILVIVALIGAYLVFHATYHRHTAECTITGKDRGGSTNADDRSSHYRIYTEQCGTLSNEDQPFSGKTNSADIQGQLTVGRTYRLEIVGWRNTLFSSFPNIIRVHGEAAK